MARRSQRRSIRRIKNTKNTKVNQSQSIEGGVQVQSGVTLKSPVTVTEKDGTKAVDTTKKKAREEDLDLDQDRQAVQARADIGRDHMIGAILDTVEREVLKCMMIEKLRLTSKMINLLQICLFMLPDLMKSKKWRS